jgi:hypothetical protein
MAGQGKRERTEGVGIRTIGQHGSRRDMNKVADEKPMLAHLERKSEIVALEFDRFRSRLAQRPLAETGGEHGAAAQGECLNKSLAAE